MAHDHATPVNRPIMTGFFKGLLAFLAVWALLLIWRFAAGIGSVSALNDGYPWGIWIAFDVVTGTALACGGYAIAILAYVLNKGKYHPLVRPAILTSALGYSMAALAIMIDVGRPWYIWRIPIRVFDWNLNSALLEVALCVMAYVGVLWIELAPAAFERWQHSAKQGLASFARKGLKFFDKALIWIVAMGVLLPTMHQSSLGTVMLLAGYKLHPLWNTAMIPLLFLISCIGMGYAIVVFESAVSSAVFKRARETSMLTSLSGAMVVVLSLFLAIRFIDLIVRGRLGIMFSFDGYSLLFWLETVLFAVPLVMLANRARRERFSTMFQAAVLIMLAGSVYRFDSYLVAYNPGAQWRYFPALPELLITLGVIALEIALYLVIVKQFPILAGGKPAADRS